MHWKACAEIALGQFIHRCHALLALKRLNESYISIWSSDHSARKRKAAAANIDDHEDSAGCPCFCSFAKDSGIVRHLKPSASLLEAVDLLLGGVQNLYCWLTQEDLIRYFLNFIGLLNPTPNQPINSHNIIDDAGILAIHYDDPAAFAIPLIAQSHIKQTSVAIVDEEGRLVGDISPFSLNSCDETVAAAIATLSAGDLMAYMDCGRPLKDLVRLVKQRLEEKNMVGLLVLMEDDLEISSGSCSNSSSSDEESSTGSARSARSGGYSARVVHRSEAIVCYPWSSLMVVIMQALALRDRLRSMAKAENPNFCPVQIQAKKQQLSRAVRSHWSV
ncbi:hypothetical protein WN944_000802 [Citrus x changshan-huyou]|uniref:CBS domain-containing protein n=1 Tax=Citrus x changshan-huyou TaxID=2935761 RepID=A0AAP0MDI5_9ROSI